MTDFGAELHRFLAEGGISLSAACAVPQLTHWL